MQRFAALSISTLAFASCAWASSLFTSVQFDAHQEPWCTPKAATGTAHASLFGYCSPAPDAPTGSGDLTANASYGHLSQSIRSGSSGLDFVDSSAMSRFVDRLYFPGLPLPATIQFTFIVGASLVWDPYAPHQSVGSSQFSFDGKTGTATSWIPEQHLSFSELMTFTEPLNAGTLDIAFTISSLVTNIYGPHSDFNASLFLSQIEILNAGSDPIWYSSQSGTAYPVVNGVQTPEPTSVLLLALPLTVVVMRRARR